MMETQLVRLPITLAAASLRSIKMIHTRILPALLAAALLVGCQTTTSTDGVDQSAISLDNVARIRAMYQEINPDTRVGYIDADLPGEQLVSVADIPVEDFRVGDAITFIDAQQQVIATGRVANIVGERVHAKYTVGERAPGVGDLAVKFVR